MVAITPKPILRASYYRIGARYYDSDIGGWVSVDPMRQFASPYATSGNLINNVDKDGRTEASAGPLQIHGGSTGYSIAKSEGSSPFSTRTDYYPLWFTPNAASWISNTYFSLFTMLRPYVDVAWSLFNIVTTDMSDKQNRIRTLNVVTQGTQGRLFNLVPDKYYAISTAIDWTLGTFYWNPATEYTAIKSDGTTYVTMPEVDINSGED